MRKLIIDIECRPNLAYVWGLYDQSVSLSQIEQVGSVISFAAKWHGSKRVLFHSDFHDGHDVMVRKAHDLVSAADVVIHYNGKAFDMKHLQREFLLAELGPAAPHQDVDLLTAVRRYFKFASNKLDHVSDELGLGRKTQHTGFDLWLRCIANDEKAWALMKRYNKQDVVLTERLYDRLLPWLDTHPNAALLDERPEACPRCGELGTIMSEGVRATRTMRYRRYRCSACGAWSRSRIADSSARPDLV
ncbi:MAG: ribonuclease H-like domain-containing protein [Ilumatobacteraceae bacterium]